MLEKLFPIVSHNIGFWIWIICSIFAAVVIKILFKSKIKFFECIIQIVVSCLAFFAFYLIFFTTSANIGDFDIRSSFVSRAEYYEEWTERYTTEECTGSGKDRSCHPVTRYRHHPEEWNIITSINENIGITKSQYSNYIQRFGNQTKKDLFRMNQSSFGDGDMFYTVMNNQDSIIPCAREYSVINYLKGSQSIKKRFGNIKGYEKLLLDYPRVYEGSYGDIEINRIMVAGIPVPSAWRKALDRKLDVVLSVLGPTKEMNVIIYIVKTKDQKFLYALEEYWNNAKKNDVIIILGINKFPVVDWAGVFSWSKDKTFDTELKNTIMELGNIEDNDKFMNKMICLGKFKRLEMNQLEYLISDITLPFWSQLVIAMLGIAVNVGLAIILIRNEW